MDNKADGLLSGPLTVVCAYCRKVRQQDDTWASVKGISKGPSARVSHGICPQCLSELLSSCEDSPPPIWPADADTSRDAPDLSTSRSSV